MTSYRILLSRTARKQLDTAPRDVARRVKMKMRILKDDPVKRRPGADIRIVYGSENPPLYRLRVGDYRILFFLMDDEVRVTEIIHRSKAYR